MQQIVISIYQMLISNIIPGVLKIKLLNYEHFHLYLYLRNDTLVNILVLK